MFEIDVKDLKGGIIFIIAIVLFCIIANWNSSQINKNNNIDNNNNMVYNVGGSLYE